MILNTNLAASKLNEILRFCRILKRSPGRTPLFASLRPQMPWHFTVLGHQLPRLQWRHNERDGVAITSITIVYLTVYSGADQRKHQSSASLAFVRGIHRWPVNSPHKGPVTRKMFPFDDVIMAVAIIKLEMSSLDLLWLSTITNKFIDQTKSPEHSWHYRRLMDEVGLLTTNCTPACCTASRYAYIWMPYN